MKIRDIRDPALFQRLVRRLYIAERGAAFQVVDDSGGDRGNDGYDASRGLLLSIYCPEKPESADHLRKGKADVTKAVQLSGQRGYHIREWAFVTPTALREPAQAELRAIAEAGGLKAFFLADEHLEDLYRRFPHLHDDFPELEYPNVEAELRKIREVLGGESAQKESTSPAPPPPATPRKQPQPSILDGFLPERLHALAMRLERGDERALAELERFRMEALDARDILTALLMELQFEQDRQHRAAAQTLAAKGLELARRANFPAERAVFAANLAHEKALELAKRDMDLVAEAGFSSVSGMPLSSPAAFTANQKATEQLSKEVDTLLEEAQAAVQESDDLIAMYIVLLRRANIVTQRHFAFTLARNLGISATAEQTIGPMKREMSAVYDAAVRAASALGDEQRLATAYSNYANDLVAFGDYDRAAEHANHALDVAKKVGDAHQIQKTEMLLRKIAHERPSR